MIITLYQTIKIMIHLPRLCKRNHLIRTRSFTQRCLRTTFWTPVGLTCLGIDLAARTQDSLQGSSEQLSFNSQIVGGGISSSQERSYHCSIHRRIHFVRPPFHYLFVKARRSSKQLFCHLSLQQTRSKKCALFLPIF